MSVVNDSFHDAHFVMGKRRQEELADEQLEL